MKVLCDTGIISRYLTRSSYYTNLAEGKIGVDNVVISSVIFIELMRWLNGYSNLTRSERTKLLRVIKSIPVLHLNEHISKMAMETSLNNKSLKPPDILIGSTAKRFKVKLATNNKKNALKSAFETIKKIH